MTLLDMKAVVRFGGGLWAVIQYFFEAQGVKNTLIFMHLDDWYNVISFASNSARVVFKYLFDDDNIIYYYLGIAVQVVIGFEVSFDYFPLIFGTNGALSQTNIVKFGNPISFVVGEFYTWAVPDEIGNILNAAWYGYSEDYWYYFAMAFIGDVDWFFVEEPGYFYLLGGTSAILYWTETISDANIHEIIINTVLVLFFAANFISSPGIAILPDIMAKIGDITGEFIAPSVLIWASRYFYWYHGFGDGSITIDSTQMLNLTLRNFLFIQAAFTNKFNMELGGWVIAILGFVFQFGMELMFQQNILMD